MELIGSKLREIDLCVFSMQIEPTPMLTSSLAVPHVVLVCRNAYLYRRHDIDDDYEMMHTVAPSHLGYQFDVLKLHY